MTMPCVNCTVTFFHAGLEYVDGSYANANTGMWLHHAVAVNRARRLASCSSFPEIVFAAGNERTPVDLTSNGCVCL